MNSIYKIRRIPKESEPEDKNITGYEVGYFLQKGDSYTWVNHKTIKTHDAAGQRCHELNGGHPITNKEDIDFE